MGPAYAVATLRGICTGASGHRPHIPAALLAAVAAAAPEGVIRELCSDGRLETALAVGEGMAREAPRGSNGTSNLSHVLFQQVLRLAAAVDPARPRFSHICAQADALREAVAERVALAVMLETSG